LRSPFLLADTSTTTVLVALAAGAIGSLVTALIGLGVRAARIASEINATDRSFANLDRHLETWVADETINLIRELRRVRAKLAACGALDSGDYGYKLGLAKEAALHRYRDQERTVQSQADDISAREGALHLFVRALRGNRLRLELEAPARVLPILDRWAEPLTPPGAKDEPKALESDPRQRTVESTLQLLEKVPKALT
jgi:hypothetical protein